MIKQEKVKTTLKNIRNKIILFYIKLKEIYKNYKVASSVVMLVFIAGIIGFIVYANSTAEIVIKSSVVDNKNTKISVDTTSDPSNFIIEGETLKALNFTTLNYNLNYYLGNSASEECSATSTTIKYVDRVMFVAKIPVEEQARWNLSDETTASIITTETIDGKDYSVLRIYDEQIKACSDHNQVMSLTILNSKKDHTIEPTIEIYSGSDNMTIEKVPGVEEGTENIASIKEKGTPAYSTSIGITTTYEGNPLKLTPKVQSALSKKVSDSKRMGKFGILLGFETANGEELDSLKGKYIDNLGEIYLKSTSGSNDIDLQEGEYKFDETDIAYKDIFGVYTSERKYFSKNELPELSTSGRVKSLKKNSYNNSEGKISSNKVEFYGAENLTYDYISGASNNLILDNVQVKINEGSELIECSSTSPICKIEAPDFKQSKIGEHELKYKITSETGATTVIKRKVTISDSTSDYKLIGPKEVVLTKDKLSLLDSFGITSSSGTPNYNISYYVNDGNNTPLTFDDKTTTEPKFYYPDGTEFEKGSIKQVYSINKSDGTTEQVSRIINLVKELPNSLVVDSYHTTGASISKGYEYKASFTKGLNSNQIECNKENNCSINYNSDFNSVGTKTGTMKIEDSAGKYEVTLTNSITVKELFYKLLIENVGFTANLTRMGSNFYAVGSYFVSTVEVPDATPSPEICLSVSMNDDGSNGSSKCVSATNSVIGTNRVENKFYVIENESNILVDKSERNGTNLNGDYYTAAMGEEVTLDTSFDYGYDADSNLNNMTITIPVNSNLKPIAFHDTIDAASTNQFFECVITDGNGIPVTTNPTFTIKYITTNGTEIDPISYKNENIASIVINVSSASIEPGSNILINTKYLVKVNTSVSDVSTLTFNSSGIKFESNIGSNTVNLLGGSNTAPSTPNVYVTPYKVRSKIKFGKIAGSEEETILRSSEELTFDASKNDTYVAAVFTDVISPALNLNSSILGYNNISTLDVKVTLPEGVNYVYNQNYNQIIPTITYEGRKTIIKYTYTGVEPNTWIEPLYFDFNIDVNAPTSNIYIKVETGDFTLKTIRNDISSSDKFKTLNKKLNIKNTLDISYGQYLYDVDKNHYISNIDKNEGFIHTIKLHNNSGNIHENLYAYSIIPFVAENASEKYSGTFEIDLPTLDSNVSEVMCTSENPANITKSEYINSHPEIWSSCETYKTPLGKYSGLTAYRIKYSSIAVGEGIETDIRYEIKDNEPADVYKFNTYYSDDSRYATSTSNYNEFHPIKLEVISKKITGIVFEDFTENGILDKDEKKIEGVVLKLYNASNDTLLDTTTSNEDGMYMFSGLQEGKYYITADFNTNKYGLTTIPSEDFYDKTRMSVFREQTQNIEDTTTSNNSEVSSSTEEIVEDDKQNTTYIIKTDEIQLTSETRIVNFINLGLSLRRSFSPHISKFISKVEITDALGVKSVKDFGNVKVAKLDVRNMSKVKIKVIYTFEIENVKYYPGYVNSVVEELPQGMSFNENYLENKGWILEENGILINNSLKDTLLYEGDKKYINIAFDISSNEAGSFINTAYIDSYQILGGE